MRERIRTVRPEPTRPSTIINRPAPVLDSASRSRMESRFGHDFSKVRVHDDAGGHEAADAVQATAFTLGSDIVLGNHAPDLSSSAGERLLAHELTHVVQQEHAAIDDFATVPVGEPGDASEVEASRVVKSVTGPSATPAPSISSQPASVQGAFWNGENLKDDFWGTHQLLGDKVGGITDAASSAFWNYAGMSEPGGIAGGAIDRTKETVAQVWGVGEALAGNSQAANADLDAANRFGHDLDADLLGMIPGVGQYAGAAAGYHDSLEMMDRINGKDPGDLSGDLFDKVDYVPTIPGILKSLYPANTVSADDLIPSGAEGGATSMDSSQTNSPGGATSTDPGLMSLPDGGATSALREMFDPN